MPYDPSKAVSFAKSKSGRYADGECWTLMEDAVVGAGGVSSKKLTPNFAPTASFVWGTPISAALVKAGDVLQFSGYKWQREITTDVTNPPGSATGGSTDTQTAQEVRGEPQHSAMVVNVAGVGVVDVAEQNIPAMFGPVQVVQLVLMARARTETTTREATRDGDIVTKVTVVETVTNPPRCYRPK